MAEASLPKKSLPKINKVDEPYWKGAAAGKLLLQKCKACGKLQFFPRVVCVDCFSGDIEWIEAKGTGKVHTFSWVRVPRNPAFKEDVPICYINVILDEGVIMESRLVGKGIDNVKLGDKVKCHFPRNARPGDQSFRALSWRLRKQGIVTYIAVTLIALTLTLSQGARESDGYKL